MKKKVHFNNQTEFSPFSEGYDFGYRQAQNGKKYCIVDFLKYKFEHQQNWQELADNGINYFVYKFNWLCYEYSFFSNSFNHLSEQYEIIPFVKELEEIITTLYYKMYSYQITSSFKNESQFFYFLCTPRSDSDIKRIISGWLINHDQNDVHERLNILLDIGNRCGHSGGFWPIYYRNELGKSFIKWTTFKKGSQSDNKRIQ